MIPSATVCKRCGGPITFAQGATGKLYPVELDGSAHWAMCQRRQRIASGLLRADGTVDREQLERIKPPGHTGTATHVYKHSCIPPWDESLGAFRGFTEEEKQAGIVCQPV